MNEHYLYEAFRELNTLNEDTFEATDDGIKALTDFDTGMPDAMATLDVIDDNAESIEDLEDSYLGKVIMDCQVCHSKLYKDKEDVKIDDDGELANVDEECPYCYSTSGFKIIGEVRPFSPDADEEEKEEDAEKEDVENIEIDTDDGADIDITVEEDAAEEEPEDDSEKNDKKKSKTEAFISSRELRRLVEGASEDEARTLEEFLSDAVKTKSPVIVLGKEKSNKLSTVKSWAEDNNLSYRTIYCGDYVDKDDKTRVNSSGIKYYAPSNKVIILNDFANATPTQWKQILSELEQAKKSAMIVALMTRNEFNGLDKSTKAKFDGFHYYYDYNLADGESDKKKTEAYMFEKKASKKSDKKSNKSENKYFIQFGENEDDVLMSGPFTANEVEKELDSYHSQFNYVSVVDEGGNSVATTPITEGLNNIEFDTESDHISISATPRDNVTASFAETFDEDVPSDDELDEGADGTMLGDLSDETKEAIETNDNNMNDEEFDLDAAVDETAAPGDEEEDLSVDGLSEDELPPLDEEEPSEEEDAEEEEKYEESFYRTVDVSVQQLNEAAFNSVINKYFNETYNNVESFTATDVSRANNKIKIEGALKFKSGANKKTSFIFEAKDIDADYRICFLGENVNITKGKKAFYMSGVLKNGEFIAENLKYKYTLVDSLTESYKPVRGSVLAD